MGKMLRLRGEMMARIGNLESRLCGLEEMPQHRYRSAEAEARREPKMDEMDASPLVPEYKPGDGSYLGTFKRIVGEVLELREMARRQAETIRISDEQIADMTAELQELRDVSEQKQEVVVLKHIAAEHAAFAEPLLAAFQKKMEVAEGYYRGSLEHNFLGEKNAWGEAINLVREALNKSAAGASPDLPADAAPLPEADMAAIARALAAPASFPPAEDPVLRAIARAPIETDPKEIAAAAEAERQFIASGGEWVTSRVASWVASWPLSSVERGQSRASFAGDVVRLSAGGRVEPRTFVVHRVVGNPVGRHEEFGEEFTAEAIAERWPILLAGNVLDADTVSPADQQNLAKPPPRQAAPVAPQQCRVNEDGDVIRVEDPFKGGWTLRGIVGKEPPSTWTTEAILERWPIALAEPVQRIRRIPSDLKLSLVLKDQEEIR